jgi:hypothetical protein
VDTSGNNRPATPTSIVWPTTPDLYRNQEVATFNGSSSLAKTGGNVLNTSNTFTVTAWVELSSTAATADVATEDGNQNSGFYLQYDHASNRWAFAMAASDTANAATIHALSPAPPLLGVWTHLAGVYDATAHTLSLYVNGTLAATTTDTTPFDSTGVFVIGRGKSNGASTGYFAGNISDVQVYGNALGATVIGDLYANNFTRCTALG